MKFILAGLKNMNVVRSCYNLVISGKLQWIYAKSMQTAGLMWGFQICNSMYVHWQEYVTAPLSCTLWNSVQGDYFVQQAVYMLLPGKQQEEDSSFVKDILLTAAS